MARPEHKCAAANTSFCGVFPHLLYFSEPSKATLEWWVKLRDLGICEPHLDSLGDILELMLIQILTILYTTFSIDCLMTMILLHIYIYRYTYI